MFFLPFKTIFFIISSYSPRKNKTPVVPSNFVAFLRASLSKMVGHKYLSPDVIDLDFWAKMPIKFSAVKYYDKSVVKKH